MKQLIIVLALTMFSPLCSYAVVDTLKSSSEIEDVLIYNYEDCLSETQGEDCRRFNAGGTTNLSVGTTNLDKKRVFFQFPGWNDTLPDSSKLMLYCKGESDTLDRTLFCYPVTRQWYEGTEVAFNVGDYPDPDSGVTWNHAYLDDGDADSVNWTSPGGDYVTDVACTLVVTNTGQYFSVDNFNRILNYWDTSGTNYGCIIINQDVFPTKTSMKTFESSEGAGNQLPLLVLYYPTTDSHSHRRRRILMR